jgi:hypothetical protein
MSNFQGAISERAVSGSMNWFNAKTRRRKAARIGCAISSLTNPGHFVTGPASGEIFFASLRPGAFALKSSRFPERVRHRKIERIHSALGVPRFLRLHVSAKKIPSHSNRLFETHHVERGKPRKMQHATHCMQNAARGRQTRMTALRRKYRAIPAKTE